MFCFIGSMVESVNAHMKNTDFRIGSVVPPDKLHKPVLYSDAKASYDLYLLNKDIYEGKKQAKSINEKKTPKSVFVALGIAALALAFPAAKKLFKK